MKLSLALSCPSCLPDTDNLAKVLLGALTGVVFHDDAQVVEVHMFKMRDNRGLCEGGTAFWVRKASNWRANMPPWMA